ncbi:protein TIC 22, chloroplastic [Momordica charantia]|uniref:Protein TIC 22, chloroplastic n=1 Tax=Momordica charantia TaxID=3673 RepID=A0A6J1CN57_MOMCH|nr:protein TIC 22, chloroplastic [Momordica charantia]
METPKPYPHANPLLSISSFIHNHCIRLGAEFSNRLEDTKRFAGTLARRWPAEANWRFLPTPAFASLTQHTNALAATLSSDQVAKSLVGTAVYTVSNSNNEFVLVSDPNGVKSIGLLCFRKEDAETFLAQARSRKRELRSNAKVVPITLDQVYMLKVEGIAFRFLPDPVQIKNALELKASDTRSSFDGVPVFQSDLLIVKKKNKRYCPIYFAKEDIERELLKVSKASRGLGTSQHIMVGSLEDVLKKMELNEKNSAWEDLIFIPPGKSHSQHIQEVGKA